MPGGWDLGIISAPCCPGGPGSPRRSTLASSRPRAYSALRNLGGHAAATLRSRGRLPRLHPSTGSGQARKRGALPAGPTERGEPSPLSNSPHGLCVSSWSTPTLCNAQYQARGRQGLLRGHRGPRFTALKRARGGAGAGRRDSQTFFSFKHRPLPLPSLSLGGRGLARHRRLKVRVCPAPAPRPPSPGAPRRRRPCRPFCS